MGPCEQGFRRGGTGNYLRAGQGLARGGLERHPARLVDKNREQERAGQSGQRQISHHDRESASGPASSATVVCEMSAPSELVIANHPMIVPRSAVGKSSVAAELAATITPFPIRLRQAKAAPSHSAGCVKCTSRPGGHRHAHRRERPHHRHGPYAAEILASPCAAPETQEADSAASKSVCWSRRATDEPPSPRENTSNCRSRWPRSRRVANTEATRLSGCDRPVGKPRRSWFWREHPQAGARFHRRLCKSGASPATVPGRAPKSEQQAPAIDSARQDRHRGRPAPVAPANAA